MTNTHLQEQQQQQDLHFYSLSTFLSMTAPCLQGQQQQPLYKHSSSNKTFIGLSTLLSTYLSFFLLFFLPCHLSFPILGLPSPTEDDNDTDANLFTRTAAATRPSSLPFFLPFFLTFFLSWVSPLQLASCLQYDMG
jgi:hypothetical protein